MVVGVVTETTECMNLGGKVNIAYLCGDDNEVLMYNMSGKEEKDSALKERHFINIRSRSRIVGFALATIDNCSCLYVLGQNADLDVIMKPADFITERRKRKLCNEKEEDLKRQANDDD